MFKLDEVVTIEYIGEYDTYDLEVAGISSFVANDFVVHNSSAKSPAVQTIPKHSLWAKKLRRGYIAPPGFLVLNVDYSQGELKICAVVSNERIMIDLYQQGLDQHMVTGGALNGYTIEQMLALKKENPELYAILRQGGKAGNFGLIYKMSVDGFIEYAYNTFGVILTKAQAEEQVNKFFNLYPGIIPWHRRQINFARRNKYVVSPLGRVRHLPLINSQNNKLRAREERRSINSPVQATLSDLSIYALSEIYKEYGHPDDLRFHLFTHDSLTAYVKADRVTYWVPRIKEIMENLPLKEVFDWDPPIKFTVDFEAGPNLGDLKKL